MKKPTRKNSIRKPHWDYRTPAYYFVTICTHQRRLFFDTPIIKEAAELVWVNIPTYDSCSHITLDQWVVMPNHVHLLFFLGETEEFKTIEYTKYLMPKSVGAVVGTFKKIVGRNVRLHLNDPDIPFWQRGYYDRIERNEAELNRIREYIRLNPERWENDNDNLDRLLGQMKYHP